MVGVTVHRTYSIIDLNYGEFLAVRTGIRRVIEHAN